MACAVAVVDLGQAVVDVDVPAVRAGGHVAEGQRVGQRLRRQGELAGEDKTQEKIMHLCTIASHAEAETAEKPSSRLTALKKILYNNAFVMGIASLILIIVGMIAFPAFRNAFNLRNLVWQGFMLVPLTLGQLVLIISGGIDLSMSATMALVSVLGLTIMLNDPGMIIPGILAMLAVGLMILLKKRPLGRRIYAVGESAVVARWSGLRVISTQYFAYVICALMSVLAAMYMLGRTGGADPMEDPRRMLDAIAYSLIGGATLAGGKGSILGAMLALCFMVILLNLTGHAGLPVFYRDALRGILLLAIIVMYERSVRKKISL